MSRDANGARRADTFKQHVDRYNVPQAVIIVDVLPKMSTGKIQKNVVRQQVTDHYRRG